MDKKRVLFQIRNCSEKEEAVLMNLLNATFPLEVDEEVIQLGYVPADDPVHTIEDVPTDGKILNSSEMNLPKDKLAAAMAQYEEENTSLEGMVKKANNVVDVEFKKL